MLPTKATGSRSSGDSEDSGDLLLGRRSSQIICCLFRISSFSHAQWAWMMPSSRKATKADILDIHAEGIEELREAFDLFDTKGKGKYLVRSICEFEGFGYNIVFYFFDKKYTYRVSYTRSFVCVRVCA